ncbi:MAG: hypothetical protein K8R86_03075, partial [Bacteroidales bacterium]|nr:hypothetical protein [Bacteroidales bacterium]
FQDLLYLKKKGKKFQIKGEVENRLENVVVDEEFQNLVLDKIEIFRPSENKSSKGGFIISENNDVLSLIKIQDKWFRINPEIKLVDFLKIILGDKLCYCLINYTKNSLRIIKKAKSYEDCINWNKPILLKLKEGIPPTEPNSNKVYVN